MYGDKAIELLRELKRAPPHLVPPHNEERMQEIVQEAESLYKEVQGTIKEHAHDKSALARPGTYGSMVVQYAAINRNKRCMLAYIMERVNRLQALRWDVGAVLPAELKENLSQHETTFFGNYNRNLGTYMENLGLDLSAHLQPPKELFIQVRCIQDVGEIMTENGFMKLDKDSQHFVRRSDVEPFIRQGLLEHII